MKRKSRLQRTYHQAGTGSGNASLESRLFRPGGTCQSLLVNASGEPIEYNYGDPIRRVSRQTMSILPIRSLWEIPGRRV